jgi:predicted aldo/keto reductase-like oxidoreductase
MEYRTLGKAGLQVSAIGLGTEYLFQKSRETFVGVVREAVGGGVNYIDAFIADPVFRDDFGAALRGCRQQVHITAHLGSVVHPDGQYGISRDPQVAERFFVDYLRRVETDYVDVIMLHNCNDLADWQKIAAPGGLLEMAQRFQREGKACYIGFSGHNAPLTRQVVESGLIDVLMFPVNLACQAVPGFVDLLLACAAHQVGLVAMKVFGGGSLLRKEQTVYLEDFQIGRSETQGAPTRWEKPVNITPWQCLAYVLVQGAVSTTVPGCKSVEEMAEVLAYWGASAAERDFSALLPAFEHYPKGQCVYCNHCLPCPAGIDIGKVSSLFDDAQRELTAEVRAAYDALQVNACDCLSCGDCEDRCPFDVPMVKRMEQAAELFA